MQPQGRVRTASWVANSVRPLDATGRRRCLGAVGTISQVRHGSRLAGIQEGVEPAAASRTTVEEAH